MEMVPHQTPGVNLPVGFPTRLPQGFQKKQLVLVVQKDGFAAITAIHRVVNGPGILNSEFARHPEAAVGEYASARSSTERSE
jgi:hypothetical protein